VAIWHSFACIRWAFLSNVKLLLSVIYRLFLLKLWTWMIAVEKFTGTSWFSVTHTHSCTRTPLLIKNLSEMEGNYMINKFASLCLEGSDGAPRGLTFPFPWAFLYPLVPPPHSHMPPTQRWLWLSPAAHQWSSCGIFSVSRMYPKDSKPWESAF
jgi:hypothetical protein